ncbi:MAG: hypothetical protein COX06_00775, partial [Candidatus Zambryskibacteria bacterium CG22_combo_CG10-13_8_21_14_all_42_17]
NFEAARYVESCKEYTNEYEYEKLLKDWADKERIAKKIVEDFKERAGELRGKTLLDAGFGNGTFAAAFTEAGAIVSGIEVNPVLLDIAKGNLKKLNLIADLKSYDGYIFPFGDNSFDYVYSTSVLEHVTDAGIFLKEINRVLRPGGKAYISFPNRLAPKETHTGVWFLSYFPRFIAEIFLKKVLKRNSIEELNLHFLSYFTLVKHLRETNLEIQFEYDSNHMIRKFIKRVLGFLGLHQSILLKTIMVILVKQK